MARNGKDFNCDLCKSKYCDESNPAPIKQWEIPGVIESDICLKPMVTAQSHQLIMLYGHYKNNVHPFSGGILEQPAKYKTAMEIIDNYSG